ERARVIGRADTTVTLHGVPAGTYGKHSPAEVASFPHLASLHTQFILDNALRAEAEGYDAFAVGSVQEPGLEEARSLVDIAVVGYGESAVHLACRLRNRFTVLVFQPGFEQIMDLRVRRLGLSERALPT